MTKFKLLIDGMLSGTGIRDAIGGGYLEPGELGLSNELTRAIAGWVSKYEQIHFQDFKDAVSVSSLDREGMALATRVAAEKPGHTVGYSSNALMRPLDPDQPA